jgi:hypothetical protein
MRVELAGSRVGNPRTPASDRAASRRDGFAQPESQSGVDIGLFRIASDLGMLIAIHHDMPAATELLEEIEAFGRRNPGHEKSIGALVKAIERIDHEFSGKTREMLLAEARRTFLSQIRTLETRERTIEALEKLRENQKALVTALEKLAVLQRTRPEDATLH